MPLTVNERVASVCNSLDIPLHNFMKKDALFSTYDDICTYLKILHTLPFTLGVFKRLADEAPHVCPPAII